MFVEYGRLKMILITLQGFLTPVTAASDAVGLPEWVKLLSGCIQGAAAALLAYLLKPATEIPAKELKEEDDK